MRKMSYDRQSPSLISFIVFLSRYQTKPFGIISIIGITKIEMFEI